MTIGTAVANGTVNNQTLGYFMARTQLFMEKIGPSMTVMRTADPYHNHHGAHAALHGEDRSVHDSNENSRSIS